MEYHTIDIPNPDSSCGNPTRLEFPTINILHSFSLFLLVTTQVHKPVLYQAFPVSLYTKTQAKASQHMLFL